MGFKYVAVTNAFQPKVDETYRFLGVPASRHGNISLLIGRRVWKGNEADKKRLGVNNVFKTIEQARSLRAKLVNLLQAEQRALTAAAIPQEVYQGGRRYRLVS